MIKCAKEMRATAAAALNGKWGDAVLTTLVLIAIVMVASFLLAFCGPLSLVATIGAVVLEAALMVAFLKMIRTGETIKTECIFSFFKETRLWVTMLLVFVYTFLWSLLLIIPGVIKGLAYAMTPFILNDNPNLQNNEAIELSMAMMDGHKWDLFCLQLSFIGWALLCTLTFGIGYLWLLPYIYTSYAAFYEDVKAEYETRAIAQ
ncbi:MAG: DUF975 family protein [Salinivirgaceae bacterium]|nr:DUF975 family protein [Salinivirgaceae bacterium]